MALPAGFIADRFLGGPTGGMRFGLGLTAVLSLGMVLLPSDTENYLPAMAFMIALAFTFFFMRSLYFAPFGEMGLPPRFSGSVIAVASFVICLPATFAYGVLGALLDARPGRGGLRAHVWQSRRCWSGRYGHRHVSQTPHRRRRFGAHRRTDLRG